MLNLRGLALCAWRSKCPILTSLIKKPIQGVGEGLNAAKELLLEEVLSLVRAINEIGWS